MKYFSLFSGIDGFEIPIQELGWECVGYSEIDKYAIQVYEKDFNHKSYEEV
jgi:DNA (cytosine-5)-methyltransferase 1